MGGGKKSHTSRIAVETRSRRRRSRTRAHGRNGYINRLDRNFQQKIGGGEKSGSNIPAADYHLLAIIITFQYIIVDATYQAKGDRPFHQPKSQGLK